MKHSLISKTLLTIGAFGLMAGTAYAQSQGQGQRGPGGGHGHGMPNPAQLDTDGDGKISLEEFLVPAQSHFQKMDANGDGYLSEDELPAPPDGNGKAPPQGESA